jgi:hypothetical protein
MRRRRSIHVLLLLVAVPVSAAAFTPLACAPAPEEGAGVAEQTLGEQEASPQPKVSGEEVLVGNEGVKGAGALPLYKGRLAKDAIRKPLFTNPGLSEKAPLGAMPLGARQGGFRFKGDVKAILPKGGMRTLGEVPKQERSTPPSSTSYGRLRLRVTDTGITVQSVLLIPGPLRPSTTIDGPYLFVVRVRGAAVLGGTFRDPLAGYAFPLGREGHSVTPLHEGTAVISVPKEILAPATLVDTRFEFYRLDPSIPYDTPVTLATLPTLIGRSTSVAVISGTEVLPFVTPKLR